MQVTLEDREKRSKRVRRASSSNAARRFPADFFKQRSKTTLKNTISLTRNPLGFRNMNIAHARDTPKFRSQTPDIGFLMDIALSPKVYPQIPSVSDAFAFTLGAQNCNVLTARATGRKFETVINKHQQKENTRTIPFKGRTSRQGSDQKLFRIRRAVIL